MACLVHDARAEAAQWLSRQLLAEADGSEILPNKEMIPPGGSGAPAGKARAIDNASH